LVAVGSAQRYSEGMTTHDDERSSLRVEHGSLYDELVVLLFRHDPIGIDFETNTDEYDPEVRAILPRLVTCTSARDVERVTYEEFVRLFDVTIAGPRSRYAQLADEIWVLWCAARR
jgi:hypothetical protein